jgi:hypothetical protein
VEPIVLNTATRALSITACLLALPGAVSATEAVQSAWRNVDRVVAFADVHGAHAELTALLRTAGVVDAQLNVGRQDTRRSLETCSTAAKTRARSWTC